MTTPEHAASGSSAAGEPGELRSERLRRPEPERTGPIRNASGYFRESRSWGEEPHPAWREPSDVLDDVVTRGVKLGYRVIEEYLRQGQRAASGIRPGDDRGGGPDDEMEQLVARVQRVYKDLGALCFDALDLISRSPALLRGLARQESGNDAARRPRPEERAASQMAAVAVAVEVAARQRVRVVLNLPPHAGGVVPAVHALHARDPDVPPLTGITFRSDSAAATPVLEISVPDPQPAALYTGVVVDQATNEPMGTLSVRVFP